MAGNFAGSSRGNISRTTRGLSGPITSNLDDKERDRQRKMLAGRPLSSRQKSAELPSRRDEPSVVIKPKETATISTKDRGVKQPDVLDTFKMLKSKADYRNGSFHTKRNDAGPMVDLLSADPKRPLRTRQQNKEKEVDDDPFAEYRYDVTKSSIGSDVAPNRPPSASAKAPPKTQKKSLMDILGSSDSPTTSKTRNDNSEERSSSANEERSSGKTPATLDDDKFSGGEEKPTTSRMGDLEMGDLDDVDDDVANLDIGPTRPVQQAALAVDSKPIDVPTASQLKCLLFGSSMGMFSNEWRYQSFSFCDLPSLKYGLVQKKGGPCGILASVQAYVLKYLLYSNGPNANEKGLNPSRQTRSEALTLALTRILWKAGDSKAAVVTLPGIKAHFTSSSKIKADGLTETLSINTLTSYDELAQFIRQNISQFEVDGTGGVILALYSAILSKSVVGVKEDMDVPTNSLMGAHGYCTQEMVNLFLTGKGASNVFNDVVELDSGTGEVTKLKGISGRSEIGLMSLFEHYRSCEVGTYMKTPRCPIWVVCSESHFSVLFSLKSKLLNDWKAERKFDLYYYDGLAKQDQEIRLTIDTTNRDFKVPNDDELVPPIDHCIRTKWPGSEVDWNDTEPIL